jgi:hypothetical protein
MLSTVNHFPVLYGDGSQMDLVVRSLIQVESQSYKRADLLTKDHGPEDSIITVERRIPRYEACSEWTCKRSFSFSDLLWGL